jgi:hypothetical protein
MLDLAKLAAKMPGISQHFQQEVAASRERVQRAKILLEQAQQQQEKLLELYHNWHDRLIFSVALLSFPPPKVIAFLPRMVPKLPLLTTKSPTVI